MNYDHIIRTCLVRIAGGTERITDTYVLKGHGLPPGFNYRIHICAEDGSIISRSCRASNGSVRYYTHASLGEAFAHGFAWTRRVTKELATDTRLFA